MTDLMSGKMGDGSPRLKRGERGDFFLCKKENNWKGDTCLFAAISSSFYDFGMGIGLNL